MIKKKATLTILEISPDEARKHLATCKSNRDLDRKHVNAFVRLINQKRFRNYGVIYADAEGNFYDSQHRLRALIETNHTATFVVVQGLLPEDMNMMIDSGKKRTTSARIESLGFAYATTLVKAIEECIETTENWRRKADMLMPDEILDYLRENEEDLLAYAKNWSAGQVKDIQVKTLVAFNLLFAKINKEKADQFFLKLTHRDTLEKGDPVHAFFQMLQSQEVATDDNAMRRNRYIRNGLLIAWNAFLQDQKLDKIVPTERRITLEGTAAETDETGKGDQESESDDVQLITGDDSEA